jgi:methionyl-tRNA formyltransferase
LTPPLRIVFAGTPEFSVPALDALHAAGHRIGAVFTQPDRPAGRGRELTASAVKRRALQLGLPVEQPVSLKTPEAQERLRSLEPDAMVVVAYGLILPQAVLDVPRLGCINIHASLLPRWRGAAPIQRALLAGDALTGVTIMRMDAGLDTGPELLRRETAVGPQDTAATLHETLSRLGAEAIVDALAGLESGRLQAYPQAGEGVTYAAKLSKDEARIDWSRPASHIDRQVRAFNPWPIAETTWRGEQVRIWTARLADVGDHAPPGTVLSGQPGRIVVTTGEGALELLRLQFPGRKPLEARDVLNSRELAGSRFGA